MEKLSNLIKGRLNNHNLSASAKSAEILHFANQLLISVLEAGHQDVKAYKFAGGTLHISVKHSSWGQEVWGSQDIVMKNLKKRFGENVIKKIRIKSV